MDGKELSYLGVGAFIFLVVMCFGVVFSSSLSYVARDDVTETVNGITVATNGTLTDFGSSYPFIQDIEGCVNATGTATLAEANYTVVTGNYDGDAGFVLLDSGAGFSGWSVNCTGVQYLKSTTASTAIIGFLVIFTTIASLFVVVVLFVIVKPIIKNFKK